MVDLYSLVAGPAARMVPIVQDLNIDWNCDENAKDI